MTLEERFRAALNDIEAEVPLRRVGLAVSGGGDSLALMLLAAGWAATGGAELLVATVDHRLRPEAAAEAALVTGLAHAAGLSHDTLTWGGWDGQGNLQDAARHARRRLIGGWAGQNRLDVVLTGHTADDQAETVLMRLARGSGVDGLAGMRMLGRESGTIWARPLLGFRRSELREWLTARGVTWADDPSNDDPRFDRVRARQMLDILSGLGLSVDRLVATSGRMQDAADALDAAAAALAGEIVTPDRGDLIVDRRALCAAPGDVRRRLLAAALMWVSGQTYRPRYDALLRLMRDCAEGRGGTLHGCLVRCRGTAGLRISREARAVADVQAQPGDPWDGRWLIDGPFQRGDRIRATGKALFDLPAWRDSGLPQESLLAAPSVWRDGGLLAAPLAGHGRGFVARLAQGRDHFAIRPLSH